jgi:hypothetical protein
MEKSINTKNASRIARAMKRDRMPFKNAVFGAWLYYFNAKWFGVMNGQFVKWYDDNEAKTSIEQNPDAIITIVGVGNQKVSTPDFIKDRKVKTISVADETELAEIMTDETGVTVKAKDLNPSEPAIPGLDKQANPVNFNRVGAIINRLRCKNPASGGQIRFMMAGDGHVNAAQRSFGLKIRAMVNKLHGW